MKFLKPAMISTISVIAFMVCSQTQSETPVTNVKATKSQSYLTAVPGPGKLTPERINASPSLSGPSLRRAAISPDGTMVTVLQGREDDARQQDLWAYDLETGKGRILVSSTDLLGASEELSAEEKTAASGRVNMVAALSPIAGSAIAC